MSRLTVLSTLLLTSTACAPPIESATERVTSELVGDERIVGQQRIPLDASGRTVVRAKVLDPDRMTTRDVDVDADDHQLVDLDALRRADAALLRARYHTADRALIARLEAGDEDVSVELALASLEDAAAVTAEVEAAGGAVERTRGRFLVVHAPAALAARLGALPQVDEVVLHQPRQNLALGIARDLAQGPLAVMHRNGTGTGLLAAVWELDTCVNKAHTDFRSVTWQARHPGTPCSTAAQQGHSTGVAGVLAADRGGTNTAGLFAGELLEVDDRNDAAVTDMWARRPQIVNASFTITLFDGAMIDEEVYRRGAFVFNGSGNDASSIAHCHAYNSLCVGGYNAGTINAYGDDTINASSGHFNFLGREYPQVVGPWAAGASASRSGTTGYTGWFGTSFATPGVAGLGALLLTNFPFALWEKPSLMRAVLMASAHAHPVYDNGLAAPRFSDAIDDRMGVGAPNGARAQAIMSGSTYRYRKITPAELGLQASFPVNMHDRVRVVVAWDQCPGYVAANPELKVDFDLSVRAPGMMPRMPEAYSNPSFADNWEVIDFVAQRNGTAEVHLSASRFGTCAAEGGVARAPVSIAWTKVAGGLATAGAEVGGVRER